MRHSICEVDFGKQLESGDFSTLLCYSNLLEELQFCWLLFGEKVKIVWEMFLNIVEGGMDLSERTKELTVLGCFLNRKL